mmetsp:Transcript_2657/g.5560  ORF Transcript_2657/g.5560 Transcript_2657/m.5560 type:complete len:86 (+) Transcript_2657:1956-2213(+)
MAEVLREAATVALTAKVRARPWRNRKASRRALQKPGCSQPQAMFLHTKAKRQRQKRLDRKKCLCLDFGSGIVLGFIRTKAVAFDT